MIQKQNILITKIEAFVKKFYLNRLIKGLLLGLFFLIALFLLVNSVEYFAWLSENGRFVLFLTLIWGGAIVFVFYIFIPVLNLIRFRKKMTVKQAAILIGRFFPDIQDKLLNTLELNDSLNHNPENELLLASIEQRTNKLSPISFSDAIDFRKNTKYFWYVLAATLLLAGLTILVPEFIIQPVNRIVKYDQTFVKALPFDVSIKTKNFETVQGSDFEIVIEVVGEQIPESFFIAREGGKQQMKKLSTNDFSFTFKKTFQDIDFTIVGGKYESEKLHLKVVPKPLLLSYQTKITYPKYISREGETIKEKTQFIVPEGSFVEWTFFTRDADNLLLVNAEDTLNLEKSNNSWKYSKKLLTTDIFNISPSNQWFSENDAINFEVEIVKDAYPEIDAKSISEPFDKTIYFSGLIGDDYGFSKFQFVSEITGENSEQKRVVVENVDFQKNVTRQQFYHSLVFDSLNVRAGDEITSYFEIWDNDAVNGAKSRKSNPFTFNIPSKEALDSIAENTEQSLADRLESSRVEAESIQKDIENLLRDLTTKKDLDWSDKEKIQDLLQKQQQLQTEWNELQKEQQNLNEFRQDNELMSQEMLEKQDKINQLFEEVIPEEIRKMMEEINRLLEEMPRENLQKMLNEFKNDSKKMQDLLDRNLALLEQLKVEKDLNKLTEDLMSLAEKLQNEEDKIAAEEAKDQFEEMQNKLDSILKKNETLDRPFKLENTDELEQEINNDLQKAGEQEQNGDQQQSKQNKQNAGSKMKEMANSLQTSMNMSGQEQLGEDAHATRILLENILRSSHQQEELMLKIGKMKKDDPSIPESIRKQSELSENFKIVEDSLRTLAKRQPMIKNFIFDELQNVKDKIEEALSDLQELRLSMAVGSQQFALMSINNLALMLAESLDEMQSDMNMSGQGQSSNQKKSKPGQGESMSNMKNMQESLGKQLEELRKQKEGKDSKSQSGQKSMSEELARMAAEQEAIRQQMQGFMEQMQAEGVKGNDGLQKIIEDMEKLEEDLVNKKIDNQTLKRNQEILTRMLESERAQKKREKEEKRESNEFKGENFGNIIDEIEYKRKIKLQDDLLRLIPIEYQPYFKMKINEYYFRKNARESFNN